MTKLTRAAVEANIEHYETLVRNAHDQWEQHLQRLQYWLEQLELTEQSEAE